MDKYLQVRDWDRLRERDTRIYTASHRDLHTDRYLQMRENELEGEGDTNFYIDIYGDL